MPTLLSFVTRHARFVFVATLTAAVAFALHPFRVAAQATSSGGSPVYRPDSSFLFEGLPWGADSVTITRRIVAKGWGRTEAPRGTKETGNNYMLVWNNRPARATLFYEHGQLSMASVDVPLDSSQARQYMTDVVADLARGHDLPGDLKVPDRGAGIGWATWKGRDANVVVSLQTSSPQFGPVITKLLVIYEAKLRPAE